MTRKYYWRSIVALLLIPVASMLSMGIFEAIDPELARGHDHYVRNFALLDQLRRDVLPAGLLLAGALWTLGCMWLLRAKSQSMAWLLLAVLGPLGLVVIVALPDRSLLAPGDALREQPRRAAQLLLRVLYEVVRFAAVAWVSMQLVEWYEDGTARLEATRRGMTLAQVLAERDASSGMWAFGDMMRAAFVFVLIYAFWPAGSNAVARLIRRLPRPRAATGGQ